MYPVTGGVDLYPSLTCAFPTVVAAAEEGRYAQMRNEQPEWISSTLVTGVHITDEGPRRVQIRVGLVRLPGSGGVRIASQAEQREIFLLPPAAVAQIMGALRRGLRDM